MKINKIMKRNLSIIKVKSSNSSPKVVESKKENKQKKEVKIKKPSKNQRHTKFKIKPSQIKAIN